MGERWGEEGKGRDGREMGRGGKRERWGREGGREGKRWGREMVRGGEKGDRWGREKERESRREGDGLMGAISYSVRSQLSQHYS